MNISVVQFVKIYILANLIIVVLYCCLLLLKATVIMRYRKASTTVQTVIKFGRQVRCIKQMLPSSLSGMHFLLEFKASKSFLKLGSEFQSHNYGAMVSHTAIVFTRYIILEWLRRNQNDEKTYDELFLMYREDIQDTDLTNALQSLTALFVEHISTLSADITSVLKSKVTEWIASQAAFIQALFENIY